MNEKRKKKKSGEKKAKGVKKTHQVVSPELVTIWLSSRKRQQDKYPKKQSSYVSFRPRSNSRSLISKIKIPSQLVCKPMELFHSSQHTSRWDRFIWCNKNTKAEARTLLTCMAWQLSAHSHVALSGFQVVYGADVVQSTTGNIVSRGCIGTSHHPGGSQRNGVHLRKDRTRECHITWQLSVFTEVIHIIN